MKTLGTLATLSMLGMGIHNAITSPPSVEAATASVKTATVQLKEAATVTNSAATTVTQTIDSPDRSTKLPDQLLAFDRTTEHLITLRNNLCKDMESYKAAYDAKLKDFDMEAGVVRDEHTQRSLANLRRHTEEDVKERMAALQGTLDELDRVITKGSDLTHAANAVLIADQLHAHGEDLDEQIKTAKQEATQYAATTNALLSRITTALAD